MISGEYEIKSNKLDDITGTERTMTLEVHIVTYEPSKKKCGFFFSRIADATQ